MYADDSDKNDLFSHNDCKTAEDILNNALETIVIILKLQIYSHNP